MCGIAGIAGPVEVNKFAVEAMTALLVHRGPDGDGIWQSNDGKVCFGHRRLAIIDLSDDAAQPMHSSDGALTITYNGEIYNYLELRSELTAVGAHFSTDSDTETILHAYQKWGAECVEHLNGMFAFAIHDARARVIFCARDRMGEKPFLFSLKNDVFAFASEYKALLCLDHIDTMPDTTKLMRFMIDPTSALDQYSTTVFADILELRGGETMLLSLVDFSLQRQFYWQPPEGDGTPIKNAVDYVQEFADTLKNAVRLRLRSDVSVGSCLSGGLDSTAITCLARKIGPSVASYQVFTGRFPGSDADEGRWADIAVAATKVRQHETSPDGVTLLEELDDFVWANELPVDSLSQYAQWCVFRLAKQHGVTVLLDGQGGDEILAGYEQYFVPYLRARRAAGVNITQEEADIRMRYPDALAIADASWKPNLPLGLRRVLSRTLRRGSSPLFGMTSDVAKQTAATFDDVDATSTLHDALRKDACNGFLSTLLRYGDRNSMAHSREVRLPFCDHRVVEMALSASPEMLMGSTETKHLLRQSMRGVLPEEIRTRWRKQGFLPPIAVWLRGPLGGLAAEIFASSSFCARGYWDARWWQDLLARFYAGREALASTIWKAMALELWHIYFVDRVAASPRYPALARK